MDAPYDLVVVGGGPAGSTLSTLVAMQNHRVLLLEKERFPRYQIGESLLPATIHTICSLLDAKGAIEEANFVRKPGGAFRWGVNPEVWYFLFGAALKKEGTSYAYQVERAKFDDILLRNARRKGVTVLEEHAVKELVVEDGRVCGLRYVDPSGAEKEVRARFVADASGNTSRLYSHVGERVYSEFFRNVALFGYFRGGKRLPEPYAGTTLSAAFPGGWFWYIPLGDDLTSVGAVVSRDHLDKVKKRNDEGLRELIDSCPAIRDLLATATRVEDGPYGEIRVRKDWSYATTRFWAPGMVLVGDAACFVDPVISSGVHLAMYAGLLAARSVNTSLLGTIDEGAAFREYTLRYRREYGTFYQFLMQFYKMDQGEDSYFWAAREVLQGKERANEAFVRLVSGVTDKGEPLYASPDEVFAARKKASDLVVQLGHAALAGDEPARASLQAELKPELDDIFRFDDVFQGLQPDGTKVKRQMFRDGLVPSDDELHWVRPQGSSEG